MMRRILFLSIFLFATAASGQVLSRERMSVLAYEDMSDWMRRFPGMYVMDYGVAGAPAVFRPWGLQPWLVGVERDGIPWNRASDGLYESNLDSPEELDKLGHSYDGLSPLGTVELRTRSLVGDTTMTEIRLREGYYGFGRVDFAHAQELSKKLSAEGRGRLFWYNGLRENISKSRFYNLAGRLDFEISEQWHTSLEYGGENVDAQSPNEIRFLGFLRRPQVYTEREYGTVRSEWTSEKIGLTIGAHLRQDRERREETISKTALFGLREQYSYGFVDGRFDPECISLKARAAVAHVEYNYLDLNEEKTTSLDLRLGASRDFGIAYMSLQGNLFPELSAAEADTIEKKNYGAAATITSGDVHGFSILAGGSAASQTVPRFWRTGAYDTGSRQLFVDDAFAASQFYNGVDRNSIARPKLNTEFKALTLGLAWKSRSSEASLGWRVISGLNSKFELRSDTLYLAGDRAHATERGPAFNCDIRLLRPLRLQSWSAVQCDPDDIMRATELRSFTRLLYSRDFFKAPLHLDSYLAYEHVGRHDAVSDSGYAIIGPAHLVHFRVEGTIEGVTLIWGIENLTAQHYMYLPGYLMIRKEEYFGLKWTMRL